MGFLSELELRKVGFRSCGRNVKISDKASIYGAERISIGDESRIDDFCILSSGIEGIEIGRFVHIAAYCSLIGRCLIRLDDFSGLSSRVSIYSSSDDYSGESMTNPCIPSQFKNVTDGEVHLGKHVIVGVGSAILPKVHINHGAAIGAFSLVSRDIEPYVIASGVPAKFIKSRSKNIDLLEKEFLTKWG
jgi:galactoside O-acetyltransferase